MDSSTSNNRRPPEDIHPGFFSPQRFENLWSDLRFGFRQAFKNKLYTSIIVLTLALCLGSNTTAYNFLKHLVTDPYQYKNGDSVALIGKRWTKRWDGVGDVSVPHYYFLKENATSFEEIGFIDQMNDYDLDLGGKVRNVTADEITPEVWSITGVDPIMGRFFKKDDVENSSGNVVVLSESLWNDLKSAGNNMLDREILLDDQKYRVIGIAPKSFYLAYTHADMWIPRVINPPENDPNKRNNHNYLLIAKLKEGISIKQADQNLRSVYETFLDIYPDDRDDSKRNGSTFGATNISNLVTQNMPQLGTAFKSVHIVTLVVLLIGCLNVSGMILVRSFSRMQEFAMRRALGASIRRLSAQIFTEILIYFFLGGVFSVFVLQLGLMSVELLGLNQIPWASNFEIDFNSIQTTFLIAFLCAVGTGVIPIFSVLKRDLIEHVKSGGRSVAGSASRHRLHGFFVISQVTLSVILLVLAGVLILNLNAVLKKDVGFATEGRVSIEVQQPGYRFGSSEDYQSNIMPFRERILEKLSSVPGVVNATASCRVPISPWHTSHSNVTMDHYEYAEGESKLNGLYVAVMPGYFDTVGTQFMKGRDFGITDTFESEKVAIIEQSMVDKYYQGVDPIGQTFRWWGNDVKIIGVVETVQAKPFFIQWDGYSIYFPYNQWTSMKGHTNFLVHVKGDPQKSIIAMEKAILDVDPKATMVSQTFNEVYEVATFAQRLPMIMTLFFASIALMLSGIGLYGLISFTVMERTKEYGIRMALGANPLKILKRILKGSGKLIFWGLVVGLLVAIALCAQINPMLSDINTLQPTVFGVVLLFVSGICLFASLIPALRATRINVIDTLRYE